MNTGCNNLFVELIQAALGARENLSRVPTEREWEALYEEAEKQAVVGLLLTGLERLPAEQLPRLELKLQWIGVTQMIEHQNKVMDERCVKVLTMLEKAELRCTILKGQGIARLYDENLRARRQPGDIDVYVDCGLEKAMAFTHSLGQKNISWSYKHLHLDLWEDTEVEVHYHVEFLFNLIKNRRLQRWFEAHKEQLFNDNENDNENKGANTNRTNETNSFTTPTVEFNVFYILLHIYKHYFTEGVGLRQVIDYFFVLKQVNGYGLAVRENILHQTSSIIHQLGMERFVNGLMWLMQEVMAMPKDWMLWEPDEKEGRIILKQVMEGGNFGQYAEGYRPGTKWNRVWTVVRRNLHLMRWYPSEALWVPVWMVCHKVWKVKKQLQLAAGTQMLVV